MASMGVSAQHGYMGMHHGVSVHNTRFGRLLEGNRCFVLRSLPLELPHPGTNVFNSSTHDNQSLNLVLKENQVQSVDGVNGPSLKIGSMNEVNTNGNWPKNYSKDN